MKQLGFQGEDAWVLIKNSFMQNAYVTLTISS